MALTVVVVVGAQWGDEGKGKVIDFYAEEADFVVRFNGGDNAGHTIMFGDKEFKFHLLPSGIVRKRVTAVMGNGMVVNPEVLLKELSYLRSKGISGFRLLISERAHVIMPYHPVLDGLEESLKGGMRAGTTGRGIGPAYSDKVARFGITMGDLLDEELLARKLKAAVAARQRLLAAYGKNEALQFQEILDDHLKMGKQLEEYITNVSTYLNKAIREGRNILFEGAQGTLLDPDHGTYPYVTSSNAVAGAAAVGAGIGPRAIDRVVGVSKAYTTRVGEGPFPTELKDSVGEHIRKVGCEFGTTTGRPRRCGWLDLSALAHAVEVNGLDALAITKLDVLGGLRRIKLAVGYEHEGRRLGGFPSNIRILAEAEPVYREMDGWEALKPEKWTALAKDGYDALPDAAREYLAFIKDELGIPIELVSVGPSREATIDLRGLPGIREVR
jgi:adenylosuccinate synthase